jgi:hypothetical protein
LELIRAKLSSKKIKHSLELNIGTYQKRAVARGKREDVGAGDHAGALGLHACLDGVDDIEATQGVGVRGCGFLTSGVQKNRAVASLRNTYTCEYAQYISNSSSLKCDL